MGAGARPAHLPSPALGAPQYPDTCSGVHPCSHTQEAQGGVEAPRGDGGPPAQMCGDPREETPPGPVSPAGSRVCGAGWQQAPTVEREAEGLCHPSPRPAPLAHTWQPPQSPGSGQFSLLRGRSCRVTPFPPRQPPPAPPGARAALTWRTGRCRAPAGCGSPPASSAGSARALGAPCCPGDAGRGAGTLGARAPSPQVPRHLLRDGPLRPPYAPRASARRGPQPLLPWRGREEAHGQP